MLLEFNGLGGSLDTSAPKVEGDAAVKAAEDSADLPADPIVTTEASPQPEKEVPSAQPRASAPKPTTEPTSSPTPEPTPPANPAPETQ